MFSAGLKNIDKGFLGKINDVPKGLLKICRNYNICLDWTLIEVYKEHPDIFNNAFNQEYITLSNKDIKDILYQQVWNGLAGEDRGYELAVNVLVEQYGYNTSLLFHYIDGLMTYEALEDPRYVIGEIFDYAKMMKKISHKFDKYPKNFLTVHKIACRNYNRLKEQFEEEEFKKIIYKGYEYQYKGYKFFYPNSTQEIKDEAVQQNNCVASYIKRVLEGKCHILFLRKADKPNESLVTIEVVNNKIVQARGKYNRNISEAEREVVDRWNKKFSIKEERKVA